jgi:hypothetical protein
MGESQQTKPTGAIADDRIGKPFLVMAGNIRRCLVCEQLFTRQEAAAHATVACYPRTCESEEQ